MADFAELDKHNYPKRTYELSAWTQLVQYLDDSGLAYLILLLGRENSWPNQLRSGP